MKTENVKYGLKTMCILWFLFMQLPYSMTQSDQLIYNNLSCKSYVTISGESNVNQFELKWSESARKNFRKEVEPANDTLFYKILIPVKEFKAGNSVMYNDFMELLKAREYPGIVLRILRTEAEKLKTGEYFYNPEIQITIAGISKNYKVPCYVINCTENDLYINGVKKIRMTDFNMSPPVKLNGLVKVNNEIDVNFGFILNFKGPNQNIVSR